MFSLPIPVTTQEAHSQAGELADKGEHLEAALRYVMLAGTIGNAEMEKAGVPEKDRKAFLAATMLIGIEIRQSMAASN
jgi:hypothetical protein